MVTGKPKGTKGGKVIKIRGGAQPRTQPYRIAEWMEYYGLDDARLAGRVGCSRESVTRYRNGTRKPPVAAIAHALNPDDPPDLLRLPPRKDRPSVDAILQDAPDGIVRSVAEFALVAMAKTGT